MSLKVYLLALMIFVIIALSGVVSGQNNADQLASNFATGFEPLSLGPPDAFEEEINHIDDAAFHYQPVYLDEWLNTILISLF